MIDITDYLIVQKPNDNNLYKIEIRSLESMFITIGETPYDLFTKIDELSAYILELSANLIEEYSTKSKLLELYETQSAVYNLQDDVTILTHDDAISYISSNGYTKIEKTESDYQKQLDNIYKKFDNAYDIIKDWTKYE